MKRGRKPLTSEVEHPFCSLCKKRKARKNGRNAFNIQKWGKFCNFCHKIIYQTDHSYRYYKESKCCFCGFVPVDPCQLDVDHIDGNHKNNTRDNLQTLCANCHRLKTKLKKEGMYR